MSTSLEETLNHPERKQAVVQDCLQLIDAEVADKSGVSGFAVKKGYGVIKSIKPGFVENVVKDLLPEFARAADPVFQEAKAEGHPVPAHFVAQKGRVADALLAITDGKAERSKNKVVKKTYGMLRKTAKDHVEAAVPRLGRLIDRHTSE